MLVRELGASLRFLLGIPLGDLVAFALLLLILGDADGVMVDLGFFLPHLIQPLDSNADSDGVVPLYLDIGVTVVVARTIIDEDSLVRLMIVHSNKATIVEQCFNDDKWYDNLLCDGIFMAYGIWLEGKESEFRIVCAYLALSLITMYFVSSHIL